jgi:O-antigen ligase
MSASPRPSSPRASPWEWAQTALLAVNLAWTTLANGGYGARIELVTLWLTAALLAVHGLALGWGGGPRRAPHPAGLLLLPFLGYALANVLWVTPVPWLGWRDWLGWAQMIAVFWVVLNGLRARGPRWTLFYTLVALGIAGVVLGCYQRFVQPEWRMVGPERDVAFLGRASGSFSIPNSFAGFLLLLIPAVVGLAIRRGTTATVRVWWGWVAAVLLLGLGLTISRGAWLALALALTLWPLVFVRGGWRRRALLAAGVFAGVTLVIVGVVTRAPSVMARAAALVQDGGEVTRPHMWRGAWKLFLDAPAVGTGAGSYNELFEKYRPEGFRDLPLWAHNEFLNTLSDYGAVGFLLFFGVIAGVTWRALNQVETSLAADRSRSDAFGTNGLWVGCGAFSLQMLLDFHLKIPALALAAAVLAGIGVASGWKIGSRQEAPSPSRGIAAIGSVGWVALLALASILWLAPKYEADALHAKARRSMFRLGEIDPSLPEFSRMLAEAHAELVRAVQKDDRNAEAWSELCYATTLLAGRTGGDRARLTREAEAAADRALGLSKGVCAEFWVRRGTIRELQGRMAEATKDFAKAVELAPTSARMWCFYGEHLSRVPGAREVAEIAAEFCLRLDPWNRGGLALRQRLAVTKSPPN